MVTRRGYLFAGQGSQYVGMGKDLFGAFAQSRAIFERADAALGFSLSRLCFEGPLEELAKTSNSQPAIVTVSIAAFEALRASFPHETAAAVAGLSLGEYAALTAAGVLSFEEAVVLVRKRGLFMEEAASARPGKMLSVIGMETETVRAVCAEAGCEVANYNCPGQVVVSGSPEAVSRVRERALAAGAKMAVELQVSGAFHSSFMQSASERLAQELGPLCFKEPLVPVVCNVTACPAGSVDEIKRNLIRQVSSSVLWEDSMRFLLGQGIRSYLEFGPGKVLRGLMRRIDPEAAVRTVENAQDIRRLQEEGMSVPKEGV